MVEQWSSKSYAWVRILLSLLVNLKSDVSFSMNSSSKSTIKNKFRNTNLNTNVKKKFINSRRLLLLSKSLGLFQRRQRVFKKYTPLIEKYYEAKKSTFSKDFNNFLNNNLLSI